MVSTLQPTQKTFQLDFSNRVIEHLGIKLYQNRPTNVIAEFVSNCWDADATVVNVDLQAGKENELPSIVITDNGRGMTRAELTDEFLIIGRNRRSNPSEKTTNGRSPMGRKGIGKLAGFGIAGKVDVLSVPNFSMRTESNKGEIRVYWLRFDLATMVKEGAAAGHSGYKPTVIADGVNLREFESLLKEHKVETTFQQIFELAQEGKGGVSVYLHNTSLKKAINPNVLLKSLGSRFTVTLLRPDFVVSVNGKHVQPVDAFPAFLDFGFGSVDAPITSTIKLAGVDREVRYWVKFVSLNDADWPLENAGVGVYAHGKIAQDRPFFFGVRGKEIFSRYLYAVIEADWLDELEDDVVSTDRRSINWETKSTEDLHTWGASKVSEWVEQFRKWRNDQPKKIIVERIRVLTPKNKLSGVEEDALAELLSGVLPSLGNDQDAKDKTTICFTEAWTHAPTRQITKTLWAEVFADGTSDPSVFSILIDKLKKNLVPEAMELAVTMAQRVAAITAMSRMLEQDKTETHLQRLIEEFPWLLGPEWEQLTANESIKTLVTKKHKPDEPAGEWSLVPAQGKLKPDFVFLSDVGQEKEFVVFELKGPECGKNLQLVEYQQLRQYLDIIRGVYADKSIKVRGILVGHDLGGFEETDKRIEIITWSAVLVKARYMHVSYLAALLKGSEPDADDARLKQIANFGGKETLALLNRLAKIGDFPEIVATTLPPTNQNL
jgi:Histidine kinase-, DNA gyrase B-, and HSP90-like ATPase